MDTFLQDLRFGLRNAAQEPWIHRRCRAGIGHRHIGVNTAIFSVVNSVLLQAAYRIPTRNA